MRDAGKWNRPAMKKSELRELGLYLLVDGLYFSAIWASWDVPTKWMRSAAYFGSTLLWVLLKEELTRWFFRLSNGGAIETKTRLSRWKLIGSSLLLLGLAVFLFVGPTGANGPDFTGDRWWLYAFAFALCGIIGVRLFQRRFKAANLEPGKKSPSHQKRGTFEESNLDSMRLDGGTVRLHG
jgi:hypothetical protein